MAETYLSSKDDEADEQPNPRSGDAKDCSEWDFVERVSVIFPCRAETNMSQTDGGPGEENSKSRKGLQPVENSRPRGVEVNIGERSGKEHDNGRRETAAGAINVGEEFGSVSLLRHGSQSA